MNNLGNLPIDLPNLLETRALVQANSGGGKSWCLRRLLEQTAGQVQQIVLDPEGEFATLREKFDYIICAPSGADAVATPATAAALARALWRAGTSAVIDIYELKAHERSLFVRRFLESLINAPRDMWHPTLVALDEIHMFAPQTGQCESTAAVIDLATRGRKRGLALVGATQRLSKLHKDVAAELLNKLIGRTALDVDVQRAADELGMTRKDALDQLRNLDPGEFFAFGPALSRTVQKTTIGPVVTTHPETGQRALIAPPPPSKTILTQLAKLEGIQREAETELKTVEELRTELANTRRKLTIAEKAAPGASEAEVERRVTEGIDRAIKLLTPSRPSAPSIGKPMLQAFDRIRSAMATIDSELAKPAMSVSSTTIEKPKMDIGRAATKVQAMQARPAAEGVSSSEQRILDAIAWWSATGVEMPSRHQVAFVASYTVNGHFNNLAGTLRGRGLLNYPAGNCLGLTEAGHQKANAPDSKPTRDDLVQRVTAVLKGEPMRRLFAALVDADAALSREDLASRAGYTVNGHFNNLVGALNGIGIAEYPTKGYVGLTGIFKGIGA